jgi:hypothetical protein
MLSLWMGLLTYKIIYIKYRIKRDLMLDLWV